MPPKPKKNEPSKKTEQKQKAKTIEDKTFGLKNKKGTKQQKFIKHVQHQVEGGNKSAKQLAKDRELSEKKKDDKKASQAELNTLFKPVEQKVGKGADPKSVLCAFFKAGQCGKGDKCKFSHDLALGRKGEKRSIYDSEKDKENEDTMENWDEIKLQEVVEQKHGESNKDIPKTTIICKYFLDAVENSKYGWFWKCPNGTACHYRHALPSGFVLKKDKKRMDEMGSNEISLEELIEKERAALSSKNLTKVTLTSFLKWKERKKQEKKAKALMAAEKKKQDYKAGRGVGISGREMFEFNPDLVDGDDAEATDDTIYTRGLRDEDDEEEEDSGPVHEINFDTFQNNDVTLNGYDIDDETGKLDMAAACSSYPDIKSEQASANDAEEADIDIDENLFEGDDIDDVDDELEKLELED